MNFVSLIKNFYLENGIDFFVYKVKYTQFFSFSSYYILEV